MNSTLTAGSDLRVDDEIDFVEEMRLRTWARRNFVPACDREATWHLVILNEMSRIDDESAVA